MGDWQRTRSGGGRLSGDEQRTGSGGPAGVRYLLCTVWLERGDAVARRQAEGGRGDMSKGHHPVRPAGGCTQTPKQAIHPGESRGQNEASWRPHLWRSSSAARRQAAAIILPCRHARSTAASSRRRCRAWNLARRTLSTLHKARACDECGAAGRPGALEGARKERGGRHRQGQSAARQRQSAEQAA